MKKLTLTITVMFLVFAGCSERKKLSLGAENEIAVIADSSTWARFQLLLEEVFEREVLTPQPEKLLTLSWSPPGMLSERIRQKNLLILGTLDNRRGTSKIIRNALGSSMIEQVKSGDVFLVTVNDQFARDQKFMILTAWDESVLRNKIRENSYQLAEIFDDAANERTMKRVLGKRSRNKLSDKLLESNGYTFKIPIDYKIILNDKENRILWLASHGTRRWFLVYWEEVDDVPVITTEWVINKRNELGVSLFDSVIVNVDYVKSERTKIGDLVAVKITGLYEKINESLGGPFVSFTFYDEASSRIYMLDGAVFAPGEEKLKFLRTLELMARSFKIR
ncbi:MAG: DUF4837 family protein [Candidatus Marinimicrobia bacterium]|nr:DUF4837 family protein [Candidatus Neomarinimicrobiota bacterium]TFB10639.1 DUF4837 family protein [Candidatus Marinimicrobia bacterium MT.SAG.2]